MDCSLPLHCLALQENIPITLFLVWASLVCIMNVSGTDTNRLAETELILFCIFAGFRFMFSVFYKLGWFVPRALAFFLALFATVGLGVNLIVAAFSI